MFEVQIIDLKVGQIVLEEDSYGNCVHKVMSEPYRENGGMWVKTMELDDMLPCILGGQSAWMPTIFMLVQDGTKMDTQEMITRLERV